jgi:hypothetical protein
VANHIAYYDVEFITALKSFMFHASDEFEKVFEIQQKKSLTSVQLFVFVK